MLTFDNEQIEFHIIIPYFLEELNGTEVYIDLMT